MDLGLHGARVLVTGGSRGIGRSIAAAFLREGSSVTICGRDERNLARARAELGTGRVRDVVADISVLHGVQQLVAGLVERDGGVDVVVANATAAAAGGSEPEYADSFAVDLMQSVRLAEELRAAQPELPFAMVCLGSRGRFDRRHPAPRVLGDEGRPAGLDEERGGGVRP